jgi:hypothetical protein
MKITEHIQRLQEILAEHGDLEMYKESKAEMVWTHLPEVSYCLMLSLRERRAKFWVEYLHTEERKGEKVVRV